MSHHQIIFAGMVFVLAACATVTSPEDRAQKAAEATYEGDARRGDEVKRICFASGIDGFTKTTNRSVIISNGTKDYLITTRNRCSDLSNALSLGVESYSSCLTRGDKLVGQDTVFGGSNRDIPSISCYVDKMYIWDEDAEAEVEAAP